MKPPDFLIIGAMKAGTTTLFEMLARHPRIFLPDEKEPDDLTRDHVLTESGRRRYFSLFKDAEPSQITGEASTASTKYPLIEGVPRRAHEVLGPKAKMIYVVRDPVDRAISHFRFFAKRGQCSPHLDEALEQNVGLIEFSQYHRQLEQWLKYFAKDNLHVVVFEAMIRDQQGTFDSVCRFLGIEPMVLPEVVHANSTEDALVPAGLMRRVVQSPLYRRGIKSLFPHSLRSRLRRVFFKAEMPANELIISDNARSQIRELLSEDLARFGEAFPGDYRLWPTWESVEP
jgi:hypothetical protein